MSTVEKVKKLKAKYINAKSKTEKTAINKELEALNKKDPNAYAQAIIACMKESNRIADELLVKKQLENILPAVSIAYIAKNYFKKSNEWFYQKLNGNIVNGKQAEFSKSELKILNFAFQDLSRKFAAVCVA
ncbi:MAG: DUF5053 domain-containing protein [Bacteroidetes bacterium]|nr:DUF5053 domain-containing protein [Bacteroidota bacterium]